MAYPWRLHVAGLFRGAMCDSMHGMLLAFHCYHAAADNQLMRSPVLEVDLADSLYL